MCYRMPPSKRPLRARLQASAPDDASTSIDALLGFRLRRVNIRLSRDFAAATGDAGLRSGEFTSLAAIAARPGISQSGICRETGLDKSAAVAVIDDLLRRGWIERGRCSEDKRRHALSITASGERALADLVARTRRIEAPVLSCLTELEATMLMALLDKVVGHILDEDN